jgi:hypothetical protein
LADRIAADDERARVATASLVSAWVEASVEPSTSGRNYTRKATVHVENQSLQPAYNASVSIGFRSDLDSWIAFGPLSVPLPLPVLSPRTRQSWDITIPLRACLVDVGPINPHPMVQIHFDDAEGVRWNRTFDGVLKEAGGKTPSPYLQTDTGDGEKQLGDLSSQFNPIPTVIGFLAALAIDDEAQSRVRAASYLDPSAPGWDELEADDWKHYRETYSSLGIAAHVHYSAPRVAYVKCLREEAAQAMIEQAGYVVLPVVIFTLRYMIDEGWKIFAIGAGAIAPDRIEFPEADLHDESFL